MDGLWWIGRCGWDDATGVRFAEGDRAFKIVIFDRWRVTAGEGIGVDILGSVGQDFGSWTLIWRFRLSGLENFELQILQICCCSSSSCCCWSCCKKIDASFSSKLDSNSCSMLFGHRLPKGPMPHVPTTCTSFCHVTLHHVMLRHVMSCYVALRYFTSC